MVFINGRKWICRNSTNMVAIINMDLNHKDRKNREIGFETSPGKRFNASSKYKAISAGFCHSFVVKTDGSLLAWGNNENGRLGIITV